MKRRSRRPKKIVISLRRTGKRNYVITYTNPRSDTKIEKRVIFSWEILDVVREFRRYLIRRGVHETTASKYVNVVKTILAHFKRYPTDEEVNNFALLYRVRVGVSVLSVWEEFQKFIRNRQLFEKTHLAIAGWGA